MKFIYIEIENINLELVFGQGEFDFLMKNPLRWLWFPSALNFKMKKKMRNEKKLHGHRFDAGNNAGVSKK